MTRVSKIKIVSPDGQSISTYKVVEESGQLKCYPLNMKVRRLTTPKVVVPADRCNFMLEDGEMVRYVGLTVEIVQLNREMQDFYAMCANGAFEYKSEGSVVKIVHPFATFFACLLSIIMLFQIIGLNGSISSFTSGVNANLQTIASVLGAKNK